MRIWILILKGWKIKFSQNLQKARGFFAAAYVRFRCESVVACATLSNSALNSCVSICFTVPLLCLPFTELQQRKAVSLLHLFSSGYNRCSISMPGNLGYNSIQAFVWKQIKRLYKPFTFIYFVSMCVCTHARMFICGKERSALRTELKLSGRQPRVFSCWAVLLAQKMLSVEAFQYSLDSWHSASRDLKASGGHITSPWSLSRKPAVQFQGLSSWLLLDYPIPFHCILLNCVLVQTRLSKAFGKTNLECVQLPTMPEALC